MKFKAQDKQNQLIENITAQHLVVGVDIAQETHVARAVNFREIALGAPLEFGNHREGFKLFERWVQDLLKTHNLSSSIVGMEPTGHYWFSLARWLVGQGVEAVLVNPHLVKKNKENRANTPSKSDRKDALVITDMIKNGYYTSAIATLRLFPLPSEIRSVKHRTGFGRLEAQYVKRHAGVKRAELLITLAKSSVGTTQALHV
jgi:transposase